jgi:hypothetical protein
MRKEYDFSKGKRGAVIPSPGKTRITIMLDDEIIEFFRARAEAEGSGYQTMINAALRSAIDQAKGTKPADRPLTATVLRKVIREELSRGSVLPGAAPNPSIERTSSKRLRRFESAGHVKR